MRSIRKRLSYANVMATVAVFMVLGGGAYALSNNSVGTKQLKNKAVKNAKIDKKTIKNSRVKKENLKGNRIKDGTLTEKELADGTLTGAKIADSSIGSSKLSDVEVFGDSFVKATATNGANAGAARTAAPEVTLFTKGPLSVTYKCFRDTGGNQTYGEIYGKTTVARSILDGQDNLDGGAVAEYLNPGTADTDRQLDEENTASGNDASYSEDEYSLGAEDGTSLIGETAIAVKNGTLAGGNGPYGAGNVCLFQGDAHG